MYLNIEKSWFFEIYPIFQYIIVSMEKQGQKSRAVVL